MSLCLRFIYRLKCDAIFIILTITRSSALLAKLKTQSYAVDSFYDFSSSSDVETDMSGQYSYSFGYWWLKGKVSVGWSSTSKVEKRTYYTVASMRIERFYSSLKEEVSPLSASAITLLNNQDYVGFFKACGPNYVRSIRRAQEVVAFFSLETISQEAASSWSVGVQASGWVQLDDNYTGGRSSSSDSSTLKISINGYGLGLTAEGSETLVARNVEEFNGVMKFAWKTMTTGEDAVHHGMVYGMEIVPWVENVQFQVASGVTDEAIEVPLQRSLIPLAYRRTNPSDTEFDNSDRNSFRCKQPSNEMDKFGYCCEIGSLFNTDTKEYDETNPEERVCRPIRQIDSAMVSENMSANGEFVARLDRALRYKIAQLNLLDRCISAVNAFPERHNFSILKSKDTVEGSSNVTIVNEVTVYEMKMALDPFNDYGTVKSTAQELDEFVEMFYAPCMAAIFGANIGNSPSTEATYFMAYPWHSHKECTYLSCFGSGMRWDRDNGGGCVPGIIAGTSAQPYTGANRSCKKDLTSFGATEVCKHDSTTLNTDQSLRTTCFQQTSAVGRIDVFLSDYCLPELSGEKLTPEKEFLLRQEATKHCTTTVEKSMNVAIRKPTRQQSTGWGGDSGRAVDGRKDGNYWRRSVSHTHWHSNAWWQVDLQGDFTIRTIKVYNRQDCCQSRLNNFKVEIYKDGSRVAELGPFGYDYETVIPVSDVEGDLVKVIIPSGYLQLAEVEVWNVYQAVVSNP